MIFGFRDNNTGEVMKEWELNSSQERFWKSPEKFVLFSGGFGCGKSLTLVLKAIDLALKYPDNFILMGRRTYPELRDTLLKEFFNTCPDIFIKEYFKAEMRVVFHNNSEIIFRHLDTMAESEIRSMNLGQAFIDQAEDISKEVFLALIGRLRRDGIADEDRKIFLSSNPKLTWLYQDFKADRKEGYALIEASTLDNQKHLSKSYVENLLKYPESWKRQYVYGIWDMSLLSDNIVFAREYIERLIGMIREPIKVHEGLEIFVEYNPKHRYQMGIDPSEGIMSGDESSITIVDMNEEEEVASWSGHVPPDVLAEKAAYFASLYEEPHNRILIIPEMNSIGLALINKLKEYNLILYRRTEEDKIMKIVTEKIGWRTTAATKPLLIARFRELLRLRDPKVYSKRTVNQFKSFIYTDEAHTNGMGAQMGFHDDRMISLFLAFWQSGPVEGGKVFSPGSMKSDVPEGSLLEVKGGKLRFKRELIPQLEIEKKWTMS